MLATVLEGVTWNSLLSGDPSPVVFAGENGGVGRVGIADDEGSAGPGDDERAVGPHGHAGLVLHARRLHARHKLVHLELGANGLAGKVVDLA